MKNKSLYKRILLKFSGGILANETGIGISPERLELFSKEIGALADKEIEIGIVIGGGNFFRGRELKTKQIERITCDQMGMLATHMNAMALRDSLVHNGYKSKVMSAIGISGVVEKFEREKAKLYLSERNVVIFAGGTGNPLVSTDSAASLKSIEIEADILLKATDVDGVYDSDPKTNPNAKLYQKVTFDEALDKKLKVMDLGSFLQCRDYGMKIRIFNINKSGILQKVVDKEGEGTLVTV